ncbi:MAG: hypothetical protein OEX12_12790 [Gammaproteobacteria bacterium]|nr:hypothetical protein [Gammaproteobacteria bacterium]
MKERRMSHIALDLTPPYNFVSRHCMRRVYLSMPLVRQHHDDTHN